MHLTRDDRHGTALRAQAAAREDEPTTALDVTIQAQIARADEEDLQKRHGT
ncbi:MAG: hypothetical protein R3E96_08740 [Planctomycetota bacterium]